MHGYREGIEYKSYLLEKKWNITGWQINRPDIFLFCNSFRVHVVLFFFYLLLNE